MSNQDIVRDAMNDPSFRAATLSAHRKQISFTSKYHDGRWTVTVKHRHGSPGQHPQGMTATGTGSTAGHAAWQALAALLG